MTPRLSHLIGAGGGVDIGSSDTEDRNPGNPDDVVAFVPSAGIEDLRAAAAAARVALPSWSRLSGPSRGEVLYRASHLIEERLEEIARDLSREMGKPIAEAKGETRRAAAILRYFAAQTLDPIGHVFDSASPTTRIMTLRQPIGVVAVITPWNFPIAIPVWKIAPALAFGNVVLFKPASAAPRTADHLVRALLDAGLPPGVVNLVFAPGDRVSTEWIETGAVDAVSFTGSSAVGRNLQLTATSHHLKVQLELGGKNAVVVAEDADIELAADAIVNGAMSSAGQKCTATSRVIAVGSIADALEHALAARVTRLAVGDQLDPGNTVGPVVDEAARTRIGTVVDQALAGGAQLIAAAEAPSRGAFVSPMLLGVSDHRSPIAQDEVFGPIVALIRAKDLDEAIQIHNATTHGLSGSIITRSAATAHVFVQAARAGVIHVNGETTGAEPHVPFGGMKGSSSFSREQGKAAREFYTETKTVYYDSLPLAGPFDGA